MKTKLEMAHEWAMKHGNAETVGSRQNMVKYAWAYADAMQAEADKRKPSGFPNVLRGACGEVVAVKVDDKEWQPDWSQAPEWANWWCLSVKHGAMWFSREPICTKSTWVMVNDVKFCATSFDEAPSFNYQGNWQDSLRKRPQ